MGQTPRAALNFTQDGSTLAWDSIFVNELAFHGVFLPFFFIVFWQVRMVNSEHYSSGFAGWTH